MTIEQLLVEIIAAISEHVVLSQSIKDSLESAPNVKLAQVNRRLRSVVVNICSLWGIVSNKQSPEIVRLCLQRSRQTPLRVVLVLDKPGTDSYGDFLPMVVPCMWWGEFYFETGRVFSRYQHLLDNLPNYCHGLQLPQLHRLTLLYPDPLGFDLDLDNIDWSFLTYELVFTSQLHKIQQTRNHFYSSWVTPKLRQLISINVVPYHTEGAELVICEVELQSSFIPEWSVAPLLSMYPHWAGLRSLTLRIGPGDMYLDGPATMDTIVLPLLENISLTFPSGDVMLYQTSFLDILDFPNVIAIDVKFIAGITDSATQYAADNVRALLRPSTDYDKLEQLTLSLSLRKATIFTAIFKRDLDNLDAKIRFAAFKDSGSDVGLVSPDPLGVERIACAKELTDVLLMQSGWHDLSEMTIVNGAEDKVERVQAAFTGWTIHYRRARRKSN